MQTHFRLLLKEQSGQGLHCLLFHLYHFDKISFKVWPICLNFRKITAKISGIPKFRNFTVPLFTGDATTTICHRYTPPEQLKLFTKNADIIVVACGIPNLITADMVKEGVTVIDVGINKVKDETTGKMKLVGDVDFEGIKLFSSDFH